MNPRDPIAWQEHIANQAAQWGADQELEACCEWVRNTPFIDLDGHDALRNARRPEPQSLNSDALQMLRIIERGDHVSAEITDTIRRALEARPND